MVCTVKKKTPAVLTAMLNRKNKVPTGMYTQCAVKKKPLVDRQRNFQIHVKPYSKNKFEKLILLVPF